VNRSAPGLAVRWPAQPRRPSDRSPRAKQAQARLHARTLSQLLCQWRARACTRRTSWWRAPDCWAWRPAGGSARRAASGRAQAWRPGVLAQSARQLHEGGHLLAEAMRSRWREHSSAGTAWQAGTASRASEAAGPVGCEGMRPTGERSALERACVLAAARCGACRMQRCCPRVAVQAARALLAPLWLAQPDFPAVHPPTRAGANRRPVDAAVYLLIEENRMACRKVYATPLPIALEAAKGTVHMQ
jgi:hypothetical protein